MDFKRKPNRLVSFDYSSKGVYFVTVCVENRICRLGKIIYTDPVDGAQMHLSEEGQLVNETICYLPNIFPSVIIHNHIVMPNHLHLLIELQNTDVSLSHVLNYFKGYVTRRTQGHMWQKSFHDHIVRDENDFMNIWRYIDNNPGKWSEDQYYIPQ